MRKMALVGFMQAQNCTNFAASWRHPDSAMDFTTPEYYQRIARTLEAGKFDLAFFDDRLSMPEFHESGDFATAVESGVRCVKIDPIACLMTMAAATTRLGLGSTYSTTYYEPFHVARLFQTMDLMTKGRAAWNVVTSLNDAEAQNMGRSEHLGHDLRYDRADEFLEIVTGHWDSWEDDAFVLDKAANRFADPAKVRRIDYSGKFLSSRGPFTVPRSPQGHPVIIQAGQSGRGRRFAAEWGEAIFVHLPTLSQGAASYAELKAECARLGRDPDGMKICTLIHPICAETTAEAEDKRALIQKLPREADSLLLLSEALNVDFGSKPMDEPFTDAEIQRMTGLQAIRDRVLAASGTKNPTPREFIKYSGRGQLHNPWVGSGKDIADIMEEWFTKPACDGFVIAATYVPGAYADFVRFVVPELQRRGLFRTEYTGATLRENMGLAKPRIGPWKRH